MELTAQIVVLFAFFIVVHMKPFLQDIVKERTECEIPVFKNFLMGRTFCGKHFRDQLSRLCLMYNDIDSSADQFKARPVAINTCCEQTCDLHYLISHCCIVNQTEVNRLQAEHERRKTATTTTTTVTPETTMGNSITKMKTIASEEYTYTRQSSAVEDTPPKKSNRYLYSSKSNLDYAQQLDFLGLIKQ